MTLHLEDVQAALIAKIKANTTTTALLANANEVRELEWVASKFLYPNIRVRVADFERQAPDCDIFDCLASVFVFADDASSLKTNQIASTVYDLLDTKNFSITVGTQLVRFGKIKAKQLGARWIEGSGVWQSEVTMSFRVS